MTDSPEFTTYQYKEIYIPGGGAVEIGDTEIYEEINLLLTHDSPFTSGVQYTNTSSELKIVFYRINGKEYNAKKSDDTVNAPSIDSPTSTTHDYETCFVPPGWTVFLGDSVIDHEGVFGVDDPTARYGEVINGVLVPAELVPQKK